jgi:hypothetical protein
MTVVFGTTFGDVAACVTLVFFDGDALALVWSAFGALGAVVFGAVVFGALGAVVFGAFVFAAGPPALLLVAVTFGTPALPCPALPLAATIVGRRTTDASAINNVIESFRSLIA